MEKVLVTGATGYIGLHCIDQLLKQGYAVNGSVRSPERKDEVYESLILFHPIRACLQKDCSGLFHLWPKSMQVLQTMHHQNSQFGGSGSASYLKMLT